LLRNHPPRREFIVLADCSAELGLEIIAETHITDYLQRGQPVLRFGPSDWDRDRALLAGANPGSEWNAHNLEAVASYNQLLDLRRKTWNLYLREPAQQAELRELFHHHGPLFVKMVRTGYAKVFGSFPTFMNSLGDLTQLADENLEVLVSEVLNIRQIQASSRSVNDEWRHHVYRHHLVATTHAFAYRTDRTDDSGREANVAKAQAVIEELFAEPFATSYVLDTCTLADGTVGVIKTSSFFSSTIYSQPAIQTIAAAIATA